MMPTCLRPVSLPFAFLLAAAPAFAQSAGELTAPTPAKAALKKEVAVPASPVFPKFTLEAALTEENITPKDIKELEKGEVIVKTRPLPKGWEGTHVVAIGLVNGTSEEVFSVVMDCVGQPKFVPHLEECKNTYAPGDDPSTATRYKQFQKLKFGFGFVSKEISYTNHMFAIRPYVSGWVLDKGDIEKSEGYWRVIPYQENKQILVYDVYNNPGMAVPDWIQEILVKSDLPKTVEVFRDRVHSLRKAKGSK